MIAEIKPANMKIFKGFSIATLPKMRILDCCRHNMTKTRNKIPAKINDFTVLQITLVFQGLESLKKIVNKKIHTFRQPLQVRVLPVLDGSIRETALGAKRPFLPRFKQ
jgi:hypothetical protein